MAAPNALGKPMLEYGHRPCLDLSSGRGFAGKGRYSLETVKRLFRLEHTTSLQMEEQMVCQQVVDNRTKTELDQDTKKREYCLMSIDIEKLNLERFSGFRKKVSRKISITGSATFGFPPAFFSENQLSAFSHVVLFFDREQRVIGLRFLKSAEDGAFKLVSYGKDEKRGATIGARSFFSRYDIDPKTYKGRYDGVKKWFEPLGDVYLIQLPERDVVFKDAYDTYKISSSPEKDPS